MMNFSIITFLILFASSQCFAQMEKNKVVEGNAAYKMKKYSAAEGHYKEALAKKRNYNRANYNLGNTKYRQGKFKEAGDQYDIVLNGTNNKDTLARVYHNMGNAYLKQKKYQEAVNAYKNSLKMNPKDEETRYNLAFAQKKLKEEGGGSSQQQNQQQQQQQQQEQEGISKEQAQRMLEELKNKEAEIQRNKKEKNKNQRKQQVDKDW